MKKSDRATGRRLHPVSVFFFIAKSIMDLLYPLIALILSTVFRGEAKPLWVAGGILLFLAVTVFIGLLTWLRFTYTIDGGVLHVEHGLFIRKKLSVPRDRMQSFDTAAGLLHQVFGVVKLQIETAGGTKPEVVLNAISRQEADYVRKALYPSHAKHAADMESPVTESAVPLPHGAASAPAAQNGFANETPDGPTKRMRLSDIVLYSATSGRVVIAIAVIGAAYTQLDNWLEDTVLWNNVLSRFAHVRLGWLIAAVFVFAWVLGVITTTIKEFGFTVSLSQDKLVIERGLLERRHASINLKRVQAVYMKINPVRSLLGLASIHLVTAVSTDKGGTPSLLIPIVKRSEAGQILEMLLPGYRLSSDLHRLTRRSLGGYLTIPVTLAAFAAIPGLIWNPYGFGWFSLALPLGTGLWSYMRYRQTAWSAEGDQLTIRYGSFSAHLALIPKKRVQWYGTTVSPLQMRRELTSFAVAVASGSGQADFRIRYMTEQSGLELTEWLRRKD
ncbi:PH domain-containing protein [Paenibacillus darwinianus]|uniref:PH domain-containing protein n=1 Tax=Paenibacillus darwinianus TaxID=1380763 RepID=UPI0004481335|nr:PH domain-containing protein [Paenibacillus darwinianus]EXX90739.1 hypothetical protein CH50_14865 [Paenibacillus darwinianus]